MVLRQGHTAVLTMLVPGVTRICVVRGRDADGNRCCVVIMRSRRHRDCRQGLPGQDQNQQHYRKLAY